MDKNNKDKNVRLLRLTNHFKSKDNVKILMRKIRYAEKYKNTCNIYEILDVLTKKKIPVPKDKNLFKNELEHIANIVICKN